MGIIYRIVHVATGRSYVGQTTLSLPKRWGAHVREARRKCRWPLHRAIAKYGAEAFTLEILEKCPDKATLDEAEVRWIASLNTKTPSGYNITAGGGGVCGFQRSDEHKRKIGDASRGRRHSEETRARLSAAKRGICQKPEHVAVRAAAHRGRKRSEETKAKISFAHKGRSLTPEWIEAVRQSKRGVPLPDTARAALCRPVRAAFVEYNSVSEAAQALGVTTTTVARRIDRCVPGYEEVVAPRSRRKRTPEQVERVRLQSSKAVIADGQRFASLTDAAAAIGVTRPGIAYRIAVARDGYAWAE